MSELTKEQLQILQQQSADSVNRLKKCMKQTHIPILIYSFIYLLIPFCLIGLVYIDNFLEYSTVNNLVKKDDEWKQDDTITNRYCYMNMNASQFFAIKVSAVLILLFQVIMDVLILVYIFNNIKDNEGKVNKGTIVMVVLYLLVTSLFLFSTGGIILDLIFRENAVFRQTSIQDNDVYCVQFANETDKNYLKTSVKASVVLLCVNVLILFIYPNLNNINIMDENYCKF